MRHGGTYYVIKRNVALLGLVLELSHLKPYPRFSFTNSLYAAWDEQFYPDGVGSWMVKLDADPQGGIRFDENFFLENSDYRVHQVRLEGGDSSSDSFCFP
jgi:selenium-binding protein 1